MSTRGPRARRSRALARASNAVCMHMDSPRPARAARLACVHTIGSALPTSPMPVLWPRSPIVARREMCTLEALQRCQEHSWWATNPTQVSYGAAAVPSGPLASAPAPWRGSTEGRVSADHFLKSHLSPSARRRVVRGACGGRCSRPWWGPKSCNGPPRPRTDPPRAPGRVRASQPALGGRQWPKGHCFAAPPVGVPHCG